MTPFLKKVGAIATAALLSCTARAVTITFDYSNTVGDQLVFTGNGNFTFNDHLVGLNPVNLQITNGLALGVQGLFGYVDGNFQIQAPVGNVATITGTGVFRIYDGTNI